MLRHFSKFVFLAGIVALSVVVFKAAAPFEFPDTRFPLDKGDKKKVNEIGATQTFKSSRDGLSNIQILFGGAQIKEGGKLSIDLLDSDCREKIAEMEQFTRSLGSDDVFRFSFPTIWDSKGKLFCLAIRFAPEEDSQEAAVFTVPNTIPEDAPELSIGGKRYLDRSLAFRPVYKNRTMLDNLVELNQRMSQYKPAFLKGTWLAAIAILSIGCSFGFLILSVLLLSKKDAPDSNEPSEEATPDNTTDTTRQNS